MEAMQEKEKLRDNNKYRCDKCVRLVEAERSLQYPQTPPVLTVHLKRFAAFCG